MKFLYRDILISVFPFIVHCMNGALHVLMLLNNKCVAYEYLHSNASYISFSISLYMNDTFR